MQTSPTTDFVVDPVELAKEFIRIDTSTGNITHRETERIASIVQALGFEVATVEAKGLLHLRADIGPDTADIRIAFVGHYDVVPTGEGWTYGPFDAHEENGVIYGRGASDMKSADAAMLCAARELAAHGIRSSVFLPADEETASAGMPALLEQTNESYDYCICGEPTSKSVLGDCIKVGRRGVLQGKITLVGDAGHAAYAERTRNVVDGVPAMLEALSREWDDECFGTRTTAVVTNLETNSPAVNVTPSRVTLTFDARFAAHRTCDDVLGEIEERLRATGHSIEISVSKRTEPYLTDGRADPASPNGKLVESVVSAIGELLSVEPLVTCDGGASDARFVAWKGVPTVEVGVPHGNMHGADEFVKTSEIKKLKDLYVRIGLKLVER